MWYKNTIEHLVGTRRVFPQSHNNLKNQGGHEDVELVRHKIESLVGNAASTCENEERRTDGGTKKSVEENENVRTMREHKRTFWFQSCPNITPI